MPAQEPGGLPAGPNGAASARRLSCAQCGAQFGCNPAGDCWCAAEPYRLPVPDVGAGDCLCPNCLRLRAGVVADQI